MQTYSSDDGTVSLKEALELIKGEFNVKFAYKEGLLDGKRVSQSLLSAEANTIEALLEKILANSDLDYKRINKKQFSIFLPEEKTAHQHNMPPNQQQKLIGSLIPMKHQCSLCYRLTEQ